MKIALSDGIKQSLLYGASIALMKGVSLLMLPFIANHIAAEEFGRLEVITTLAVIGSILVGMGLEDTLFRFAGPEQNAEKRRHISAEIFTLTIVIGVLTLIGGWMLAPIITPHFPGDPSVYEIRLVLSLLALEGCIAIPLGWLRMNNKAVSFFLVSTGRALFQALLVVVFLYLDRGVTGILEAGLIATALQTVILCALQLRDTGIKFNLSTCKKSFIYSLPIVGSGLVAFALNGMDRWILAENAGLAEVAEFGIAAKFALAMVLLMQPFGMWWSPRRFEVLNNENGEQKVAEIIAMGTTIALVITVAVGLISPALINWLLPESYHQASQYVVAIVIVMLLKELVELFNIGCFNGNTTSSQLIINVIAAVVGIIAMLWLTPIYHVWGIIGALLLAQLLRLVLFYRISQHFLPLVYPIRAMLVITVLSALWLLFSLQINSLLYAIAAVFSATLSLIVVAQYLKLMDLKKQFSRKAS